MKKVKIAPKVRDTISVTLKPVSTSTKKTEPTNDKTTT